MAELEDIVRRKNYSLKIDWNCSKCNTRTNLVGTLLNRDPTDKSELNWEDILHKKCPKCKFIERPTRKCTKCGKYYDFDQIGCKTCDSELSIVIDLEEKCFELEDIVKKLKRKKTDYTKEDVELQQIITKLYHLGYKPCILCFREYGLGDKFTCKTCIGQI